MAYIEFNHIVKEYAAGETTIRALNDASFFVEKGELFFTKQGMCKLVDGGEFDVAKRNVAATKLQDDDEVVCVEIFKEQKTVVLQSTDGYFLRFAMEEIPEKKKAAVGVRAIKLVEGDTVSAVYCLNYNDPATIEYKSKQLDLNKIKLGKRDSKGVKVRA